ncbi:MAG: PAS domain-containing protein, partial [Vogesella sp.]|uniref:PAS domain-containing protein n=1 Tax=Vogesella sp. TaxID=1904252 RepID=UPI003F318116
MRLSLKSLLPMVVLFFLLLTLAGAYGVAEQGRRQQAFRDASLVAQKDAYHLLQELSLSGPLRVNEELMLLATDARLAQAVVANSRGLIAHAMQQQDVGRSIDTLPGLPAGLLQQAWQHSLAILQPDYDKQYLYLAVSVPDQEGQELRGVRKGMVVLAYDLGPQLALERSKLQQSFVLPCVMLCCLLLVLYLLVWLYVARPLANLQAAALQLAQHGHAPVLPLQGISETRAVCEAFNTMQRQLQHTLGELAERERSASNLAKEQEALLQAIPDLLFEMSADGRYLQVWSHTASDKLVSPREYLLGKHVHEAMPPEQAAIIQSVIVEALCHGESVGKQITLVLPDGPHRFELSAARKVAANGSE